MKKILFLFAACLSLTACSGVELLNASITRDGYTVTRDLAYGPNARQKLDIYVPQHARNAPVIVFYYGGSWQMGSKDDYRFLGQALTEQGFVTVIANYRLYPEVSYPVFVEDSARAFAYAHAHISEYGGDANHMFVAGHSAGAYNALMVGGDPQYLKAAGGDPRWVKGIIGIAGPYDFLPFTDDTIKALFSTAPDRATMPINHIHGKIPPVMFAVGDADDIVDPRNSYRVKAKLDRLHSPVVVHTYPDTGHIGIILSLAQGFRERTPLLSDITDFVKEHSGQ